MPSLKALAATLLLSGIVSAYPKASTTTSTHWGFATITSTVIPSNGHPLVRPDHRAGHSASPRLYTTTLAYARPTTLFFEITTVEMDHKTSKKPTNDHGIVITAFNGVSSPIAVRDAAVATAAAAADVAEEASSGPIFVVTSGPVLAATSTSPEGKVTTPIAVRDDGYDKDEYDNARVMEAFAFGVAFSTPSADKRGIITTPVVGRNEAIASKAASSDSVSITTSTHPMGKIPTSIAARNGHAELLETNSSEPSSVTASPTLTWGTTGVKAPIRSREAAVTPAGTLLDWLTPTYTDIRAELFSLLKSGLPSAPTPPASYWTVSFEPVPTKDVMSKKVSQAFAKRNISDAKLASIDWNTHFTDAQWRQMVMNGLQEDQVPHKMDLREIFWFYYVKMWEDTMRKFSTFLNQSSSASAKNSSLTYPNTTSDRQLLSKTNATWHNATVASNQEMAFLADLNLDRLQANMISKMQNYNVNDTRVKFELDTMNNTKHYSAQFEGSLDEWAHVGIDKMKQFIQKGLAPMDLPQRDDVAIKYYHAMLEVFHDAHAGGSLGKQALTKRFFANIVGPVAVALANLLRLTGVAASIAAKIPAAGLSAGPPVIRIWPGAQILLNVSWWSLVLTLPFAITALGPIIKKLNLAKQTVDPSHHHHSPRDLLSSDWLNRTTEAMGDSLVDTVCMHLSESCASADQFDLKKMIAAGLDFQLETFKLSPTLARFAHTIGEQFMEDSQNDTLAMTKAKMVYAVRQIAGQHQEIFEGLEITTGQANATNMSMYAPEKNMNKTLASGFAPFSNASAIQKARFNGSGAVVETLARQRRSINVSSSEESELRGRQIQLFGERICRPYGYPCATSQYCCNNGFCRMHKNNRFFLGKQSWICTWDPLGHEFPDHVPQEQKDPFDWSRN